MLRFHGRTAAVCLLAGTVCFSPAHADRTDAASAGRRLTLAEARERALAHSPDLLSARAAAAAAAGAARQAGAWANPEFEIEAEEFGGDRPGWDEAELTWSLTQRLELFGTRGTRARAARHLQDAAASSADAARLDLLAEVDRRFADALLARSRVEAFEETDSVAAEAVRAVTALVEAGEESPIEIDRTEAERSLASSRLRTARFEHASALRSLARLWGALEPDFDGVEGSLETVAGGLGTLDSLAMRGNGLPDLRRAESEVRRAEAEVRFSQRSRLPDLAVRGGWKQLRANGEHSYVGSLAWTLPLLDRRGGAIEEAKARLEQARAEREATESRIALARATAQEELAAAQEASRALREGSLRRAEAVHAAVQEGYQRGKFRLLDLIDARRFLLQTRLEYLDAMRSVWVARAELERWTGEGMAGTRGESR
ncbi:MAG: TolC family protein [Candidatus Eisenbacteria bacterium]